MANQTITAAGFSQEIGVHTSTVLKWIRSGRLRAKKNASNQWEIPVSELDRMKSQIEQEEVGSEEAKAAYRTLEVRWRQGLVDRMREVLLAAQRYRMDMWEWKQEEDPIQQQELFNRVMRVSFPDLLNIAADAKRWHDFGDVGAEMFKDVKGRGDRK